MRDYAALAARLQAFRADAAKLLADADSHTGYGTPAAYADHFRVWQKALIDLQSVTPINPPAAPSPGFTSYDL